MKKKLYIALMLCLTVLLCAACGKKKEEDPAKALKDEVVKFVGTDLPGIAAERDEAVKAFNDAMAAAAEPSETLKKVKETCIPTMESYLNKLNALETTTPEVGELKELYRQSAQKQYDAMKMVVSAIEGENPDYLNQANTLITEAKTALSDYDAKLREICGANNITLTTGTSGATATDAN